MTRSADFILPVRAACRALQEAGIRTFPVSLKKILRHYGIRLLSYGDYCRISGCTAEDCIIWFGKDASSVRWKNDAMILYNEKRTPPLRIRFSIAHELGHILLGHHAEEDREALSGENDARELYEVQEEEANCFARNLLCPAPGVEALFNIYGYKSGGPDDGAMRTVWRRRDSFAAWPGEKVSDSRLVEQAFLLSATAAGTRLCSLTEDLKRTDREDARKIRQVIRHTAALRCRACEEPWVPGASACHACGSKGKFSFFASEKGAELPYPSRDGLVCRVNVCPVCGKASHAPSARYCTRCGISLINACEGSESGVKEDAHANPPFARYCLRCGKPTAFFRQNLLSEEGELLSVPRPKENRQRKRRPEAMDFMELSEDLSPRPRLCPRCGTDNRKTRTDCRVCQCPLDNTCTACGAKNNRDAHYCACCGKITPYEQFHVFDPAVQKRERSLAKIILAPYELRGLYYEWEDGPKVDDW
ncbi:MAG: ImmA/IrrE family metallo-endopeptidase [Oscillospiraceae bacterium]|nr:ImmA/IrrE family metallo-endopeptidase [Oscillospiraceae bacterium]